MAEVRHVYERDLIPPVPYKEWQQRTFKLGSPEPPRNGWKAFGLSYSVGHVRWTMGPDQPHMLSPSRYWLLRVPLWPLAVPGAIVSVVGVTRWARRRRDALRRGFAVQAPAKPA
jgi:hypothetical protein